MSIVFLCYSTLFVYLDVLCFYEIHSGRVEISTVSAVAGRDGVYTLVAPREDSALQFVRLSSKDSKHSQLEVPVIFERKLNNGNFKRAQSSSLRCVFASVTRGVWLTVRTIFVIF